MATLVSNTGTGAFPYTIPPLSNISPFTYRDGMTYLELLYSLRDYITGITPQVDGKLADLLAQFNAGSAAWAARFDAFTANFQDEVRLLNESAVAGMVPAGAVHDALLTLISAEIGTATTAQQAYTDDAVTAAATLLEAADTSLAGDIAAANVRIDATNTAVDAKLAAAARGTAGGVASLDAGAKVPAAQLPAAGGRGTFLARPAANTVPAGYQYNAYDTQETYLSDGADWYTIGHGGVFATAKLGTKFSTSNNGPIVGGADVPGMAVTFTAGTRPVEISLSATLSNTGGNTMTTAGVMVNGAFVGLFAKSWQGPVPEKWNTTEVTRNLSFAPGTVNTVKVQLWWDDNTDPTGKTALMDADSTLTVKSS